jgi:hypothetical protein
MILRILLTAACIVASTSTAFAQGRENSGREMSAAEQQRHVAAEEKRVQGRLDWMEQQIAKEERVLNQGLKRAAALRAAGIKSNNEKQIKQALAIETHAFEIYSKRIATFEKSAAKADKAQVAANKSKKAKKKPQPKSSPRRFRLFN